MDPGPAGDHGSLVLLPVVVGSNPEPDLVAIQRLNMAALTAPGRRLAPKLVTLIIVPVSQSPFDRQVKIDFSHNDTWLQSMKTNQAYKDWKCITDMQQC